MDPLKAFDIQFIGLKLGSHLFEYHVKQTFFENFEFYDFNDTDAIIFLKLEKKTTLLELNFKVEGSVNINCDVSNEPFNQFINSEFKLVVKFGSEYNDDNESILIIPHGSHKINVAQYIYEFIILSVPQKRVHPGIANGTLNSEILKKLEKLGPKAYRNNNSSNDPDPRWNALKKLLTEKESENGASKKKNLKN